VPFASVSGVSHTLIPKRDLDKLLAFDRASVGQLPFESFFAEAVPQ
jgi:hypothetical protein